jgi:hypothetical membrane protein
MKNKRTTWAGFILLCCGAVFWLVNTAAEALFPYFVVRTDTLSQLGVPFTPTYALWTGMVVVVGLGWLAGAGLYFGQAGRRAWLVPNLLPGAGLLLLAGFPAGSEAGWWHLLAAYWIFISSGLAALIGALTIRSPYRWVSLALGALTLGLLAAVLINPEPLIPTLGLGGAERLVAYPIFIWLMTFGGYLLGRASGESG